MRDDNKDPWGVVRPTLEVGLIYQFRFSGDKRRFLCVLVNHSRARLLPLSLGFRTIKYTEAGKKVEKQIKEPDQAMNVAPSAGLDEVAVSDLTYEELGRYIKLEQLTLDEESTEMADSTQSAVAEAPIAPAVGKSGKTKEQINKERIERLQAANAKRAEIKAAKVASGEVVTGETRTKAPKTPKPCHCGCGQQTGGYFYPGHDARFKGWMLKVERGEMKVSDLPETVQKSYDWIKTEKGERTATNYKGQVHDGYDLQK